MYTSFHIHNFRGFNDLKLDDLARVNLIAGKNNVGKTSFLEALFLHGGNNNPELPIRLNAFRGLPRVQIQLSPWSDAPWDSLFTKFDTAEGITLQAKTETGEENWLKVTVVTDPDELRKIRSPVPSDGNGSSSLSSTQELIRVLRLEYHNRDQIKIAHAIIDREGIKAEAVPPSQADMVFLSARGRPSLEEETNRFTGLVKSNKKQILLDVLTVLEKRLLNLELLTFCGETMLHGEVEQGRSFPLIYMGDGLTRLASIVLAISYARDGNILIDEIENGIHYSVLKDVWKGIATAAHEFNTQIFATTHSLECIRAAHQAFSESDPYDFRYHRLDRDEKTGEISVETYDEKLIEASIQADFEVR